MMADIVTAIFFLCLFCFVLFFNSWDKLGCCKQLATAVWQMLWLSGIVRKQCMFVKSRGPNSSAKRMEPAQVFDFALPHQLKR